MYDLHPIENAVVYRTWPADAGDGKRFRILVLKLDHVGDLWMGIAPLRELREKFAHAHITLVVGSWNIKTAQRFRLADDYVCFDFFSSNPRVRKDQKPAKEINAVLEGRFDLAIDMRVPDDTRDVLLAAPADLLAAVTDSAKHPRINISIGAPKLKLRRSPIYKLVQRTPLFGRLPRRWFDRNVDIDQLRIQHVATTLSLLVARVANHFENRSRLVAEREQSDTDSTAPIVVAPFSNSALRDWPIENFRDLVSNISRDRHVVLVGRSDNHEALEDLAQSTAATNRQNIEVASSLSEDTFNSLLGSAALVVSNNSGAGHVAAQLGRPTIGVFSASHLPDLWGFQGPKVSMLMSSIECRGCGLDVAHRCPQNVRCKTDITVEAVLKEIAALTGIGQRDVAENPVGVVPGLPMRSGTVATFDASPA